jgi:hypothetical protein
MGQLKGGNPLEELKEFVDDLRWAEGDRIEPEYERGYRHAEDDIKRRLTVIVDKIL